LTAEPPAHRAGLRSGRVGDDHIRQPGVASHPYGFLGKHALLAALADVLIAATAVARGVAVYTRDRDFERLSGVDVVIV